MSQYIDAENLINYLFDKNYIYEYYGIKKDNWKKSAGNNDIPYNVTFATEEMATATVNFSIFTKSNKHFIRINNLRSAFSLYLKEDDFEYIVTNFTIIL